VLLLYTRFFEFTQQRLHLILLQLCTRLPALRVLVVGKGPQGEEDILVQAAIRDGFHDNLVLAGWLEPLQLPDCLAAADGALYLFDDTLVNRTKCPAKLAELAAAGVPVAAERVGQIGEYLQHGESGLLVEAGDLDGLVAATERILTDRDLGIRLGQAAAERIKTVFSWELRASELEQFYRELGNR
jgi:glycosyltransferase involved in cell wall biosynthesis